MYGRWWAGGRVVHSARRDLLSPVRARLGCAAGGRQSTALAGPVTGGVAASGVALAGQPTDPGSLCTDAVVTVRAGTGLSIPMWVIIGS